MRIDFINEPPKKVLTFKHRKNAILATASFNWLNPRRNDREGIPPASSHRNQSPALLAAGGTHPLLAIQFVDVRAYRKVFEVGKMAPALARLNPSQLLLWFGMRRNVVPAERFAVQFFGKAEQQLRRLGCRL
jgi:hypothetical protein